MNKRKIIFVILCITSLFAGCDKSDSDKSMVTTKSVVEQTTTNTTKSEEERAFASEELIAENEGQMVEIILAVMENKDPSQDDYQIETQSQNGVYIYSPTFPEDFSSARMWLNGSYIYYKYENQYLSDLKESGNVTDAVILGNSLSLTWAFKADGEIALQNDIEYWNEEGYPVNEIANMSGYYYADFGIYQKIFWCEDGYSFELQIPTSVGSVNTATHEYSGEDVFTLQKTFYPFDDNTVAE